ncbi:MAG: hypothetical protein J07HX64_01877 [halophilic archaeon J07HX64]|nr:MAG: hypothetical protein J07HX64_01877 [halophilic archaeon J07HX64]
MAIECVDGDDGGERGSLVPIDKRMIGDQQSQQFDGLLVERLRPLTEVALLNVLHHVLHITG